MTDVLAEAKLLVETHGGLRAASRASGIPFTTLQRRYRAALELNAAGADTEIEFPDIPDAEPDVEELVKRLCTDFEKLSAAKKAKNWAEIKIHTDEPTGVLWLGDPHIDNPGTDWPLLYRHIEIVRSTPGVYSILGNDMTDNWVGRLARLYAHSNLSKTRSNRLVKWILTEAGMRPIAVIGGNHDEWNEGMDLIRAMSAPFVPVDSWGAKVALRFANDRICRIHMKHDFAGNSQWNPLHAAQKHALWGEEAHVYACAHKHNWAMYRSEHEHRGYVYSLVRARGYKTYDDHSARLGFGNQEAGASTFIVIDPKSRTESGFVTCFDDVDVGARYLRFLRSGG